MIHNPEKIVDICSTESDNVLKQYIDEAYLAWMHIHLQREWQNAKLHALGLAPGTEYKVEIEWIRDHYQRIDRYMQELAKRYTIQEAKELKM